MTLDQGSTNVLETTAELPHGYNNLTAHHMMTHIYGGLHMAWRGVGNTTATALGGYHIALAVNGAPWPSHQRRGKQDSIVTKPPTPGPGGNIRASQDTQSCQRE